MKYPVMYLFILIFLCCVCNVMGELEEDSKLYVKIYIKKETNNDTFEKRVVKGSNIFVKFYVSYYTDEAGFLETGKQKPNWAPYNATLLSLEVDINKTKVIAGFAPIREKRKNWGFIFLSHRDHCNSPENRNKIPSFCTYELNNREYYVPRYYTLKFTVTDFVKITVNDKELKAYSTSGYIANRMVFLYEFKYRPGNYTFTCTYLEKELVKSKWMNDLRIYPETTSKEVSQTLALRKENDTKTFNCVFTNNRKDNNGDEINIRASIQFKYIPVSDVLTMEVNGKRQDNATSNDKFGETYDVYYNNKEVINITCIPDLDGCKTDKCGMSLEIAYPSPGKNNEFVNMWRTMSGKSISEKLTLVEENDGAFVKCYYTNNNYKNIQTIVQVRFNLIKRVADMALTFNNTTVTPNNIYLIKYEEEFVNIGCSGNISKSPYMNLNMYLILQKNNETINGSKTDLEISEGSNFYSGKIVLDVKIKHKDAIKCVLKEATISDHEVKSINVKVQKIFETTTISTPPIIPGDHKSDISDQSKQSAQNGRAGIFSESWVIYAIISVAGIVIIIIIACIIKVSRNKPRDAEELVPAEYETQHDTPPPPNFPHNATLEETYCRPADSKASEPTYSQPYIPKSPEELYSKPIPKTARKKQVKDPLYASLDIEDNYAKVKPKSERNKNVQVEEPGYAEVGKFNDEPTYASVQHYANLNSKDAKEEEYYNVFNKSSYANSKQNAEYVEPSYCEVNKVRK